ncbi:MAG: 4Fe-4S binding protein [Atopobiaceae bacterium]|nr:4Fe-4S binding protein [Atopobiaceae bacterium]
MTSKRGVVTGLICVAMALIAYYAWNLSFFEYESNIYTTTADRLFTLDYVARLSPLLLIGLLSAIGIVLCVVVRGRMRRRDPLYGSFASKVGVRASGPAAGTHTAGAHVAGTRIAGRRPSAFMAVRWICMAGSFALMVFGGILLGTRFAQVSIPVLSCPANMSQLTEATCYYLAHLDELAALPWTGIAAYVLSTLAFVLVFGRMLCGFVCPMGFAQDVMHKIRQATRVEGVAMTDRMYKALVPIRWTMLLLMIGLCFVGGNFCNFCPAIALSPVAAGLSVSLYASGFIMVFVLIASFFKRRFFCTICPLGYLMGLAHKVQPFRLRKDCTACTECGACYEACPMGIKQIYTERQKSDVTDIACIMCGECVRCCPENDALALTCAGRPIYVSKRSRVVEGYGRKDHE